MYRRQSRHLEVFLGLFGKTFLLRLSPSIFSTLDKGIFQEELAVYLCYRIHFDGVRLGADR